MKHKISMLFFGAVCTLGSYAAQASLISYDFTQNTGFVFDTIQNTNGTSSGLKYASSGLGNDAFDPGVNDTVSWGYNDLAGGGLEWNSQDRYSGLRFLGKTGTVVEGGGWALLTELYHDNNALAEGALSLASVNIRTLTEFFVPGTNNLIFSDSSDTPLTFTETLNQQPCQIPGGNPCADNFSIADIFAPLSLGNGLQLEFRTNVIGPNPIVIDEGDTIKVWTQEDQLSRVDVEMRLVRVPEPSSIFLFGSMLFGLVVMKTPRKN
jgi:hypothetical protein